MESELKNDRRLFYFFNYAGHATVTFYLTFPIVYGLYGYYTKGLGQWKFPIPGIYFFDVHQSPLYEILYVWYIDGFLYSMYGAIGIDTIYYGAICNICGHFAIIKKRFSEIEFSKNDAGNPERKVFSDEFVRLIEYHVKVIEISERLREFYQPIIYGSFVLSPIFLCALTYQLILVIGELNFFMYFSFVLTILGQVFIYCSGGTKIAYAVLLNFNFYSNCFQIFVNISESKYFGWYLLE